MYEWPDRLLDDRAYLVFLVVTFTRDKTGGVSAGTQDDYYWSPDKQDTNGEAFKVTIRGADMTYIYTYPRGYIISERLATSSTYVGASNAFGHYQHQQIGLSFGISLTSIGMSISQNASAFDPAPDTNASFNIGY
ncbi:MAG: hypothetical protein P4L59_09520 [Desulfosporosinus sp.]|nr:hypothetical protein [Desulfosporosinus sp.]